MNKTKVRPLRKQNFHFQIGRYKNNCNVVKKELRKNFGGKKVEDRWDR